METGIRYIIYSLNRSRHGDHTVITRHELVNRHGI
jgi:hypothetical protein